MNRASLLGALVASIACFAAASPRAPLPAASSRPDETGIEYVRLTAEDKIVIAATFYAPKGAAKSPAAILVHDAGSKGDDLSELAELLCKRGIAVLVPDLRGHGRSTTSDMDWSALDEAARARLWAFAARDLSACADWLRGRRDVHTSNLTLVGVLGGSTLAVHHAVKDENARAVVLVSPQAEQLGFNLAGDVRELGGLPTLIVAEKEAGDLCARLSEAAHQANGSGAFIETRLIKAARCELLAGKKVKNDLVDWVRDQVMPRRGK